MKKISLLLLPLITVPFLANCVSSPAEFYTITWNLDNGNEPITERYKKGEMPYYKGDYPTKTADDVGSYVFANTWSPAIKEVTQDQTYTANYDISYNDTYLKINVPEDSSNKIFDFNYSGKLEATDWGDGTKDGKNIHTYSEPGEYNIRIYGSVTSIYSINEANQSCLKELIFGNKFNKITDNNFTNAISLEKVIISDSVSEIGTNNFVNSPLKTIIVGEKNNYYTGSRSKDLIIENETSTLLYGVDGNAIIPSTVLNIGAHAFEGRNHVTNIQCPTLLQTIGNSAFKNCLNLQSIKLSNQIQTIGNDAFSGCGSLASIELPDSLQSIGSGAFSGCKSLQSVKIPNQVQELNDNVFDGCSSLESVTLNDSIKLIGKFAFSGCSALESIDLPNSLQTIDRGAFVGCASLQSINIPDTVTLLGDQYTSGVFEGCENLTSVVLPSNITYLSYRLFDGCSLLESINIPDTVQSIGNSAFNETGLLEVKLPESLVSMGANVFRYCTQLQSVTFPKSNKLTYIPSLCFLACALEEVNIPDGVQTIGYKAFYSNHNLKKVNLPSTLTEIEHHAFGGCDLSLIEIPTLVTSIGTEAFAGNKNLKEVFIPKTVKSLEEGVFRNGKDFCIFIEGDEEQTESWDEGWLNGTTDPHVFYNYKGKVEVDDFEVVIVEGGAIINKYIGDPTKSSITIPKEVTYGGSVFPITGIYNGLFKDFTNLTEVTFDAQNEIEYLGTSAFEGCTALTTINNFPNNLDSLGSRTFYNCDSLTSVTLPDNIQKIEERAFENCDKLITVQLPSSLKKLGGYVFQDCEVLETIGGDIPSQVNEMGEFVFSGCSALNDKINIPEAIQKISKRTFNNCKNLKSVILHNQITEIEEGAFENADSLESIVFPNSLKNIGYSAFHLCDKLTEAILPDSLETLHDDAFSSCPELKTVYIPEKIKKLSTWTFFNCPKLETVTFAPNSQLEYLGSYIFYDANISSIKIPGSVTYIGPQCFSDCERLEDVDLTAYTSTSIDSIPECCVDSFKKCSPELQFHVYSKEMYEAFKTAGKNWPTSESSYYW